MGQNKRSKEKKSKAKKEVAMAKGRAYDNFFPGLETKEGEKELYRLARQRDRAGENLQHVRVLKDENGNVIVNSEAVLKRLKENFEKIMNEENDRERRTEKVEMSNKEVNYDSREEVKNALRMIVVVVVFFWKGINFRSDTNKAGAEGLSFYYPRLLYCLDQMLAVML